MVHRLTRWLLTQRSSPRLAFLLQIGCRALTSLLSLLWIPLLLGSMGKPLNGLFLNFHSIVSMGGLGELGMGGLVNIQTSRLLGQGKEHELRKLLATARAFFGVMALLAGGVFLVIAPGLLRWQKFDTVAGVGPLAGLGIVGALAVVLLLLTSYITSLNYGCGNVVWPVIPGFVIMQLGFLAHWLLARQGASLWVQYLPYQAGAVVAFLLGWAWIRLSHPLLGTLRPLTFAWRQLLSLTGNSFWVYLGCVASSVTTTISGMLITAGFGPAVLPTYRYNSKLCELTLFVIVSASAASLPKITQWLASPEAGTRQSAVRDIERLNQFQTLLGCTGALLYLAVNDWFIRFWLGKSLHAPLSWQAAFAASLAITSAGQIGWDVAARCCDRGIRVVGVAAALMMLLNLGLSLAAMKVGSIFGIALSGVISGTAALLAMGWYSCRQIGMSWWRLSLRTWLLALAVTVLGVIMRILMPVQSALAGGVTVGVCLAAILLIAFLLGIRIKDVRREIAILRSLFGRG
jgi:O-antigen/teichoic acid export membrane protein